MNELSRFKPLDHLPLAPGVCYICRGGVGPFIDTSLTKEFEGAVYICIGCIKEMHSQLGLNSVVNAEEVDSLIEESAARAYSEGRRDMMGELSAFVNSRTSRDAGNDSPVSDSPVDSSVATGDGAKEDSGKSRQANVEDSGSLSFQEPGILSGDSSSGDSLFQFE
jgi:hypothetical protein